MKTKCLTLIALVMLPLAFARAQSPQRFAKADANHDKMLSLDEANGYLVGELFSALDKNKDGKIPKAEWMMASKNASQAEEFRVRDANADGIVTLAEALAYGKKKGLARELMTAADKNKDGKLSLEEINAYYASKAGPAR
ncbi:MAG: EF-hand domain-containing protein [Chthoniobacterales bacterium]